MVLRRPREGGRVSTLAFVLLMVFVGWCFLCALVLSLGCAAKCADDASDLLLARRTRNRCGTEDREVYERLAEPSTNSAGVAYNDPAHDQGGNP